MTIGRQLVALFLLVIMSTLGAFAYYTYRSTLDHQRELVVASTLAQAELLATLLPGQDQATRLEAVRSASLGTGSRVRVVSSSGELLADSQEREPAVKRVGTSLVAESKRTTEPVPPVTHDFTQETRDIPPDHRLPGEPETIPTLLINAPMRDGGVVLFQRPLLDLEILGLELKLRITILLLLSTGVVFLVGFLFARWVATPLDRLVHMSENFGRGEAVENAPVHGAIEIARLERSFQEMARQVESRETLLRQFVGDASHELKTPLSCMKALLEALRAGGLESPDTAERFLGRLESEVERLADLVDKLLTLHRLESGVALDPIDFDLGELAAEVGEGVVVKTPDRGPVVTGDPSLLRQVLLNLVQNARQATRETPQPHITLEVDSSGRVSVTDNGVGIEEGHREAIFERLYRVEEGRARSDGGSGLGLAISRAVVETHGGRLQVESTPGEGSRFTFRVGKVE